MGLPAWEANICLSLFQKLKVLKFLSFFCSRVSRDEIIE